MILAGFIGYQFGMGAVLDDTTLVEYSNLVAELATGQAMADIDSGLVTSNIVELGVDLRLGKGAFPLDCIQTGFRQDFSG